MVDTKLTENCFIVSLNFMGSFHNLGFGEKSEHLRHKEKGEDLTSQGRKN